MGLWPISCGTSVGSFTNELEMVPLGWRRQQEPASYTERELNNYRIGSDPPTVNASLRQVDGVLRNNNHRSAMSEKELRCDSGNLSYFHRDVSLNRRSEEGWRDRNSVLGEIGDSRSVSEAENGSGSWFSSNTEVSEAEPERVQGLVYLVEDGLHGLQGFRLADFRNELLGNFQTVASPASVLGASLPRKSRNSAFLSNHNQCYYYCYHAYGGGIGMEYAASPCTSFISPNSHVGLGYPIRHNEVDTRYTLRRFRSSLLEEFHIDRKNFSRLSEIAGNIVKFSTDQDGSRFIQQKLETASTEEKIMVYTEIEPYALELMNDVYGNYVIQKILEHGIDTQRRELASMLNGRVLTFSRTIYGCRVIQKAIEVADLDQKIKIIQEFDGYIMECVHDQNANHVIQKCIKCVPEKHIQFIFESFFDQVALLSTHPYGCRVIQVLVHCKDPWTRRKVIKEILDSVSMLAQDQYGNYVVQHVIEHGKPHERSAVIMKLAGEIVEMSQQKYASNVVEKCLYYGNAQEREILVNEMLVCTADYDPLQVMMKDQFANYVVQKALDVCSDQQMKHIVSRCFASFNVLKKYTYAKHIVSRVENLTATGERRMVGQNSGRA